MCVFVVFVLCSVCVEREFWMKFIDEKLCEKQYKEDENDQKTQRKHIL